MVLSIISWIIVGVIAGWVASLIMRTDASMGMLANVAVGVVGAFIGGWLVGLFGISISEGVLSVSSILTAILGAVVLLAIIRALSGGMSHRHHPA